MIKVCKLRIPKVKSLESILPNTFKVDGLVIIRDYYFDTIINILNHIIDNQYKGNNYKQIKHSIRYLMTSVNHTGKHIIATQEEKSILLKAIKPIKTSAHYNNLNQTINEVVHIISLCLVLNQDAFHLFHFLNQRFNRTHS